LAKLAYGWENCRVTRWLLLGLLAGCYDPTINAGGACTDVCPGDLECVNNVCVIAGTTHPDAAVHDAISIDGRPIDGPPGDGDGDGVLDNVDNCPSKANVDQHDEDGDAIGDLCDPCPHINGDKADQDGDGVGDACDPQPTIAKQSIIFFDPFTTNRSEWTAAGGATITGDTLKLTGAVGYRDLTIGTGELRIVTAGTVASVNASGSEHHITIEFGQASNSSYHYVEFYDTGGATGDIAITKYDGVSNYTSLATTTYSGILPTGAFAMRVDESVSQQTINFQSTVGGVVKPLLTGDTDAMAPALAASTFLELTEQSADVRFNYLLVIKTTP
jgi:hypothetical protein